MSAPHLVTTRRTALGGALVGLAAVAGCDDGPSSDELTTGATTAPAKAADTDLVDEVTSQILAAHGVVLAIRSDSPKLRQTLRPLERLHGAHLRALDAGAGDGVDTDSAAARPGIAQVRAAEGRLERQLTDAAVAAESGALAGLLASMAAAVAQHVAVLP